MWRIFRFVLSNIEGSLFQMTVCLLQVLAAVNLSVSQQPPSISKIRPWAKLIISRSCERNLPFLRTFRSNNGFLHKLHVNTSIQLVLLLKETPIRCGLPSLVDRVLFGVEYPYQTHLQALNLVPKSSYKLLVVGFHLMIIEDQFSENCLV